MFKVIVYRSDSWVGYVTSLRTRHYMSSGWQGIDGYNRISSDQTVYLRHTSGVLLRIDSPSYELT